MIHMKKKYIEILLGASESLLILNPFLIADLESLFIMYASEMNEIQERELQLK